MKMSYYEHAEAILDEAERIHEKARNEVDPTMKGIYLGKLEEIHARMRKLHTEALNDAGLFEPPFTLRQRIMGWLRG